MPKVVPDHVGGQGQIGSQTAPPREPRFRELTPIPIIPLLGGSYPAQEDTFEMCHVRDFCSFDFPLMRVYKLLLTDFFVTTPTLQRRCNVALSARLRPRRGYGRFSSRTGMSSVERK